MTEATITSIAQLEGICQYPSGFFYKNIILVQNDELHLSHRDIEAWQEKINSFKYECGCSHGKKAVIISLGIYIIACLLCLNTYSYQQKICIGFAITIATAATGKIAGLLQAKKEYKNTIRELLIILKN